MNSKHDHKKTTNKSNKPKMQVLSDNEKKNVVGGWSWYSGTSYFSSAFTVRGISLNHNETLVEDAE